MRWLLLFIVLLAPAVAGPAGVAAQEATPSAPGSALSALGYPELVIRVIDDAFEMPETTVAAGRTLIRLENAGAESWHGFMLRLPEGVTDEQVAVDLGPEAEAPPEWLFEATFPGFPGETLPGQTNLAVVDLSPGRHLILGDSAQPFEVVGASATPVPVEVATANGAVGLFEYGFQFPENVEPGRHIWEVTNTGREPHEFLLISSSEPVTGTQIVELFTSESEDENATPIGGGPSFAEIEPVGGMGWLSPGATAWTEVDLQPGTYAAVCFIFDPATGAPHVALGMADVFTVGDPAATPAP